MDADGLCKESEGLIQNSATVLFEAGLDHEARDSPEGLAGESQQTDSVESVNQTQVFRHLLSGCQGSTEAICGLSAHRDVQSSRD